MFCVKVLVELMPQHAHLHARPVVDDLPDEAVAAVSRRVPADDVWHAVLRLLIDADEAVVVVLPADVRKMDAVVLILEVARPDRLNVVQQPPSRFFRVEYAPARHAPHAEAVDGVVVFVGLLESLQRLDVLFIKKPIVLVGALVRQRAVVSRIKESLFEPMRDADGVERQDDLLVVRRLATQSDVQLVEVALQQLACLLNPDACDVEDGLQLLHVVQPAEQYLAPVLEADVHVSALPLRDVVDVVLIELIRLRAQLLEAALPQRLVHLAAHKEPVACFGGATF